MSLLSTLAAIGTVISGVVSLGFILAYVVDRLTGGRVRRRFRRWSGQDDLAEQLERLEQEQQVTQAFLEDLGVSHNELVEVVCEEHEVPPEEEPPGVHTEWYRRIAAVEDQEWTAGDFIDDEEAS